MKKQILILDLSTKFAVFLSHMLGSWKATKFPKKVRGKSRECHNHKLQPFPDTKRKGKPTKPNKHKSNKRTKTTKLALSSPSEVIAVLKVLKNTNTK